MAAIVVTSLLFAGTTALVPSLLSVSRGEGGDQSHDVPRSVEGQGKSIRDHPDTSAHRATSQGLSSPNGISPLRLVWEVLTNIGRSVWVLGHAMYALIVVLVGFVEAGFVEMDPSQNGGFTPSAGSSSYAPTVTQSSPVQSALHSYRATLSPLIQTIGQNLSTLSALLRPHIAATLNTAFEGVRTFLGAGCVVWNVATPLPRRPQPPTDMYVDAAGMVIVEVDLPGMARDAVEVHLRDRTIEVNCSTSSPRENVEYIRRRRLSGPLETVIKGIPAEVTVDDVNVTMKHGLLRIAFPKAKPRTEPLSGTRITVVASGE